MSLDIQHTPSQTVGQQIREAREAAGISRERLAAKVGCSTQTLYVIEKDRVSPRLSFLAKLALHIDISAEHLLQLEPTAA